MVSKMEQLHNTNELQAVMEIRALQFKIRELFLGQEKIFLFSYTDYLFLNFPGIPTEPSAQLLNPQWVCNISLSVLTLL